MSDNTLLTIGLDHEPPPEFERLFEAARTRIEEFAPDMSYENGDRFADRLLSHQQRVADDGYRFLQTLGYSAQEALSLKHALLLHDIGKTDDAYRVDPYIWNRADKEQARADEPEKRRHTTRGLHVLNELVRKACPGIDRHPQLEVCRAVVVGHHERINASGYPAGISQLPLWLQVAGLVDTFDGDGILRTGQAPRTGEQILYRMSGKDPAAPKYTGAFDADLFKKFVIYKTGQD